MIHIAISQAAFAAIARTLPLGSVSFENKIDEDGNRLIWLERRMLDKLRSYRRPDESYSDVILRVAAEAAMSKRHRGHQHARLIGVEDL
jgi:hypothetical protein